VGGAKETETERVRERERLLQGFCCIAALTSMTSQLYRRSNNTKFIVQQHKLKTKHQAIQFLLIYLRRKIDGETSSVAM
jgi:hypothetical protein